jgi:hypothetical protein
VKTDNWRKVVDTSKKSPADFVTLKQGEPHRPGKMMTVAAMTVMIMQTIRIRQGVNGDSKAEEARSAP